MSKTICDGGRLTHGATHRCTATTAVRSSVSHFASLQRSPTMIGVVETCLVRPLQAVGRPQHGCAAQNSLLS